MPQTKLPEITVRNHVGFWLLLFAVMIIFYDAYKNISNGSLGNLHCGYDSVVLCWIKMKAHPLMYSLMLLLHIFAIFEFSRVICVSHQKLKVRWAFGLIKKEWGFSEISSVKIKTAHTRYGKITYLEIQFDKKFRLFIFYEKSYLKVRSMEHGYHEFLQYLHRNNVRIVYEC